MFFQNDSYMYFNIISSSWQDRICDLIHFVQISPYRTPQKALSKNENAQGRSIVFLGHPYRLILLSSRRSSSVIPSKNSSIILSSRSYIGKVWQQVDREQAAGPWVVQDTVARLPSVSFRMLPTVYVPTGLASL